MSTSTLQTKRITHTKPIGAMESGEYGYAVPWALDADTGRVRTDYTVVPHTFGTCKLWVLCLVPGLVYRHELQDEML